MFKLNLVFRVNASFDPSTNPALMKYPLHSVINKPVPYSIISMIATLISGGMTFNANNALMTALTTTLLIITAAVAPVKAADHADLGSSLVSHLDTAAIATPVASGIADPDLERKLQRQGDPTRQKFAQILQLAKTKNWRSQNFPQIMQLVAEQLVGAPYVAGLLDQPSTETLLVYLDKFDCVLLVENVLALAQTIALEDDSFDNFRFRVQQLRYRGGNIDGYCSRLHYFTDWINDNQKRQAVDNISAKFSTQFASQRLPHALDFMSNHRSSYAQLKKDDANFACIKAVEQNLAQRPIYYIPTAQIPKAVSQIQAGDIIAITTKVKGLDATHTGIAYRNSNGTIGLLHASPSGKVTISRNLYLYVKGVPESIGIMVVRPTDPRLR